MFTKDFVVYHVHVDVTAYQQFGCVYIAVERTADAEANKAEAIRVTNETVELVKHIPIAEQKITKCEEITNVAMVHQLHVTNQLWTVDDLALAKAAQIPLYLPGNDTLN